MCFLDKRVRKAFALCDMDASVPKKIRKKRNPYGLSVKKQKEKKKKKKKTKGLPKKDRP